jgi:ABC-type tungstate transport system permease subunit
LTDRATFVQLASTLRLEILHENDPQYINTYAVMTRSGLADGRLKNANRLFDWLVGAEGRQLIGEFRIKEQPAFTVWPASAPADRPGALPNGR